MTDLNQVIGLNFVAALDLSQFEFIFPLLDIWVFMLKSALFLAYKLKL